MNQGARPVRERILREFIATNKNKTGPQLERDFGNSASLFLVRITAWLRLTYGVTVCGVFGEQYKVKRASPSTTSAICLVMT